MTDTRLKIIFAGTPHFAATALQKLLEDKYCVVAVLTQPDRPAGRGMKMVASPVKQLAERHGLPVLQPPTLKSAESQQQLEALQADVMVVAAYGLLLPAEVLRIPRHGCLNIHASLLPRWRGAAPIQRAVLAGDAETGVTIMQMDVGLDTGCMLLKKSCRIGDDDTAQTLHDRLADIGAEAIVEVLAGLGSGKHTPEKQDDTLATYAAKLTKSEAQIDWAQDAIQLQRAIRAYNPFPVAHTTLNDMPVKVWQASLSRQQVTAAPGTVLDVEKDGIVVACGSGALRLEVLQRPNAKAMPAAQFINGVTVQAGDRFG